MPDVTQQPVPTVALGGAQREAGLQPFNLARFGQEVAGEIGVDPGNLGAYGLSEEALRTLESQLHSRSRRGGSR